MSGSDPGDRLWEADVDGGVTPRDAGGLPDPNVATRADEEKRLGAVEIELSHQELRHLLDPFVHRLFQRCALAGPNPVFGGLQPDAPRRSPFDQPHTDIDLAGDFHPGAADFAITHGRVDVADPQQGALNMDGQVDRRADTGGVEVGVAAGRAGVRRVDRSLGRGGAQHADHRPRLEAHLSAEYKVVAIGLDHADAEVAHAVLQDPCALENPYPALWAETDGENLHGECVTRFGPLDPDRAGGGVDLFRIADGDEFRHVRRFMNPSGGRVVGFDGDHAA